jgi:hypothetical protein
MYKSRGRAVVASTGTSSMIFSKEYGSADTIAEFDRDLRWSPMIVRSGLTGHMQFPYPADNGVDQLRHHPDKQLTDCRPSALPSLPPRAALAGNTSAGPPRPLSLGHSGFRCWSCARHAIDCARHAADPARSHGV